MRGNARHTISLLPILGAYTLISVLKPHPSGTDEATYIGYARNLLHGHYAQPNTLNPSAFLWHGPGLPAFLAPLVELHVPLGVMRVLAGPVLLFAALCVFGALARLCVSERAALLATYGLALYLPFFTVIGDIYVEPLATLCLTLAVFFAIRGGRRDHYGAGVALAALALSRVEYGYVVLAALLLSGVWLLASRRSVAARRSTIAAAVALLLCVPWLGYTYSLTHKPFYWGNSGGDSLFWMTAQGNLGDWHSGTEVFTVPQLASFRPLFAKLAPLAPAVQDERLEHLAALKIRQEPLHYLANVGRNVGRLLFNVPYSFGQAKAPFSFTREKDGAVIYAVPNALLLGLLALALVTAVRRRIGADLLPIAVLLVLGFAVHVPLAAYARFAIPLAPAAAGLVLATLSRCSSSSPRVPGSTPAS